MIGFTRSVVAAVSLSSVLVFAQPAPPGPPPPPPSDAPVVAAPPPPVEAAAPVEPAAPGVHPGRLRFGGSGGFGTFFPGPMIDIGFEGRFGYQFTQILGVYATLGRNSGFWFGGTVTSSSATVNVGAVGYWQFGVEGEAILGDTFFVAAGPKIINGGWAFVSQGGSSSGGSQTVGVVSGWLPAIDTRIGLAFGKTRKDGRRYQFVMALQSLFIFGSGGVKVTQSGGQTGASQSVAPLGGIGIAPLLTFGFEAR